MPAMAEARKPRKGGRPKSDTPLKPTISLKRTPEWRDWLKALSEHMRQPSTMTIDRALVMYAEANGFKEPMPRK